MELETYSMRRGTMVLQQALWEGGLHSALVGKNRRSVVWEKGRREEKRREGEGEGE